MKLTFNYRMKHNHVLHPIRLNRYLKFYFKNAIKHSKLNKFFFGLTHFETIVNTTFHTCTRFCGGFPELQIMKIWNCENDIIRTMRAYDDWTVRNWNVTSSCVESEWTVKTSKPKHLSHWKIDKPKNWVSIRGSM